MAATRKMTYGTITVPGVGRRAVYSDHLPARWYVEIERETYAIKGKKTPAIPNRYAYDSEIARVRKYWTGKTVSFLVTRDPHLEHAPKWWK